MNEAIMSMLLSQEVERETRKRLFDRYDPDHLYKDEMWDSLDSGLSLKKSLQRIVAVVGRRGPSRAVSKGSRRWPDGTLQPRLLPDDAAAGVHRRTPT